MFRLEILRCLDKRYDKHNFLIHDYFLPSPFDKLRPGGVMALVTSKGTMDKTNSSVTKIYRPESRPFGSNQIAE